MKKVIRLTESDLTRIVKRVIKEQNQLNAEEVYEIQTALNDYFKMKKVMMNGKLYQVPVDSKWGPATINGLKKFQSLEGIDPDGIPGPKTYNAFHKLGLAQDLMDKLITWLSNLF
jgi:peptidoglycan hydrolase-like protein with peptidoglycan-binding domain